MSPLPRPFVGPLSDRALPLQVSQDPVRPEGELWHIQAQAGLSAAAIVAVDIFFHFFYILTIPSDLKFASRLPDSALGGSPARGGDRAITGIGSCTQHPTVLGLRTESGMCRTHVCFIAQNPYSPKLQVTLEGGGWFSWVTGAWRTPPGRCRVSIGGGGGTEQDSVHGRG